MAAKSIKSNPLARAIALAVLLAVGPFLVGRFALHLNAEARAHAELTAMAERYVARVERAVAETVATLRDLDRAGMGGCEAEQRAAQIGRLAVSAFARRLMVIDRDGRMMCVAPEAEPPRKAVMPEAVPGDRRVVLSVLDPEFLGEGLLLVTWNGAANGAGEIGDGRRLGAVIDRDAVQVDPGPDDFRAWRSIEVLLDDDRRWLTWEGATAQRPDQLMTAEARSAVFPILARVVLPREVVYEAYRSLELVLTVGTILLGVALTMLATFVTWRPEKQNEDELARAVVREEFFPWYQPVVNITTGDLEGCEMLARWVKPNGQVVLPGRFMPYAETTEHIYDITRTLMRRSADDLGELYRRNRHLKLSINLFAGHFDDRNIVEDVIAIFGGGPIAFEQLVFEVTERYPLADLDQARKIMAEMRALGCKIALDDTGTGHGGLAYIQKLGIDVIKIDKMFVDLIGQDHQSAKIVDILVELAHSLGMGIVAEGVETDDQIDRLADIGVTAAQGFAFSPALSAPLYIQFAEELLGQSSIEPEAPRRAA